MIQLRSAHPDEWTSLQQLNNEVFVDNAKYDSDLDLDWALSERGQKYFQALVIDPASLCVVAVTETGQLVGYLAASPKPIDYRLSKYLEIDNMGVIPAYRSQGLGQQLITYCSDWAKKHDYQKLFVNAYSANQLAIHFYQKQGFSTIDISLEKLL